MFKFIDKSIFICKNDKKLTTMKALTLIFVAIATLCPFNTNAQEKKTLEDFAVWRTVSWNIDQKKLVEVNLLNPTASQTIRQDTSITTRPEKIQATLVVIRPRELDFKFGHRHSDFVKQVLAIGFKPVPRWVPVQMYINANDIKSKTCFCDDGVSTEYYCLGTEKSRGYQRDIFTEKPFGDPRIPWVFMWPGTPAK